jgi:hypothetical protein
MGWMDGSLAWQFQVDCVSCWNLSISLGIRNLQKKHSTSLSRCNLLYWKMFVYVVFKYISYCLVYDGLKSKKQELLAQENIL